MRPLLHAFLASLLTAGLAADAAAQHHGDAAHDASSHAAAPAAGSRKPAAKDEAHGSHGDDPKSPAKAPTAAGHGESHEADGSRPARAGASRPAHASPSQSAHASETSDAPAGQAAAPRRPASPSELDAVLARISKKIADRKAGAATARPGTTHSSTPGKGAAAAIGRSRVSLVWRPTVIWPVALTPLRPAGSSGGVGVAWPAAVDVSAAASR